MKDVIELKGVGDKTKKGLEKLGISYIEDFYTYFPRQYDKMSPPVKIEDAKRGEINTLRVKLMTTPTTKRVRSLAISTCIFSDDTGSLENTLSCLRLMSITKWKIHYNRFIR